MLFLIVMKQFISPSILFTIISSYFSIISLLLINKVTIGGLHSFISVIHVWIFPSQWLVLQFFIPQLHFISFKLDSDLELFRLSKFKAVYHKNVPMSDAINKSWILQIIDTVLLFYKVCRVTYPLPKYH